MHNQMDFDYIYKQMKENVAKVKPEDSLIYQIQETIEQSSEESTKITKKQNKISNWIQVLTLITTVLTLLATVWFGLRG